MELKELQQKKEELIRRYMSLQDAVDQYNAKIYEVCCEVEALNLMIADEEKKRAKAKANGASTPKPAPTKSGTASAG